MAKQRPRRQGSSTVSTEDLAAIAAMATVTGRAVSDAGPAATPADPPSNPTPAQSAASAGVTSRSLHEARVLLSEQNSVTGTRLKLVKRVVLRGSRLFTHKLVGAGQNMADAVEVLEVTEGHAIAQLQVQVDQLAATLAQQAAHSQSLTATTAQLSLDSSRISNNLHAQLASLEMAMDDVSGASARAAAELAENTRGLHENARSFDARLSSLESRADHDRSELHRTRTLVSRLVRTASAEIEAPAVGIDSGGRPPVASPPGSPATLDDSTYVDFEHRFRGTREEIRNRQKDAVPFMEPLAGSTYPVLDLGCGRGEWLDLLKELDVRAYGVDSNTAMVEEAH